MGYVGNIPGEKFTTINKQTLTGDGGTGYTLSQSVGNAQEIEVYVNNVRQEPGVAYTVSGTTLTMTGNVAAADSFYVIFQGKAVNTATVDDARDIRLRDGVEMIFGDSDDLKIKHTGSRSVISDAGTGGLRISASADLEIMNSAATETKAKFTTDGAVELYYDNTKRFETTSTGVKIPGDLFITDNAVGFGQLELAGASGAYIDLKSPSSDDYDLRFITDGTVSNIRADDLHLQSASNENYIDATANGAVNLYYDNTKMFETTSTGVTVGGTESTFGGGSSGEYKIILESSSAARQNYIGMTSHDNLVIAADEDNAGTDSNIRFRIDASEKMRLLSTGQLALGATSISSSGTPILETTGAISIIKNHTDTASSGNVSFGAGNQGLTITNNQGGADNYTSKLGFTVATTSANSDGLIEFASTNSNGSGEFRFYVESANTLNKKMTLQSSGALLVGTDTAGSAGSGDIVAATGIFLGGTSGANRLDDYEEGDFTVTLRRAGNSNGQSSRTCRYKKIGSVVILNFVNDGTVSPYYGPVPPGSSYAADQSVEIVSQLPFTPTMGNAAVRLGHSRTLKNQSELAIGCRHNSTTIYLGRSGANNNYYPSNNAVTENGQTNISIIATFIYQSE